MDKITSNFLREFSEERNLAKENESEQFEAFCAFSVISNEFDGEFNPVDLRTGGGNDLAIDAAALLINGDLVTDPQEIEDLKEINKYLQARIILVQAKTSGSFDGARITDLTDNLCDFFSDSPTLPMNEELKNFKALIECLYSNSTSFRRGSPDLIIRYVTTGTWTNDPHLNAKLAAAKKRIEALNIFNNVDFQCIGAKEVQTLYRSANNTVESEFNFPNQVLLPDIDGVEQAYLGTVSASEYMRVVTDPTGNIRKSLFYDNVRDFQDYNEVNKGIRGTLQDAAMRGQFCILNNGITIVAREMGVVGNKFTIRDYQVVNGCQTSHVLFDERENLGDVFIPLRLIVTKNEALASNVTAATNKQTQVSGEDLQALEAFQKQLEDYFQAHGSEQSLFYERRSRQYSTVPHLEKTRIVTRSQLVKSYAAMFLDEPWRAGRYYKQLLKVRGTEIFRTDDIPAPYYVSATAAYRVEYMFRNGYLDNKYKPARYQLLMALRHYLAPGVVPKKQRDLDKYCQSLVAILWDQSKFDAAIKKLVVVVDEAVAQTEEDGILDRDTVRTQQFTDLITAGVKAIKLPEISS